MQNLYSTAKLVKDSRIAVDDDRAHSVCLDQPPELEADMGLTALELGVMSYARCFATIFALMAKKMRVPLKDLEVKLEAIKSEEAGAVAEANFNITVKTDATEDIVQKNFQANSGKLPSWETLRKSGVKVSYNIKTEK